MSSPRTPAQDALAKMLGPLDGGQIPGGCETCDAYQTVELAGSGVWRITVHQDEDCATYQQVRGGDS